MQEYIYAHTDDGNNRRQPCAIPTGESCYHRCVDPNRKVKLKLNLYSTEPQVTVGDPQCRREVAREDGALSPALTTQVRTP